MTTWSDDKSFQTALERGVERGFSSIEDFEKKRQDYMTRLLERRATVVDRSGERQMPRFSSVALKIAPAILLVIAVLAIPRIIPQLFPKSEVKTFAFLNAQQEPDPLSIDVNALSDAFNAVTTHPSFTPAVIGLTLLFFAISRIRRHSRLARNRSALAKPPQNSPPPSSQEPSQASQGS